MNPSSLGVSPNETHAGMPDVQSTRDARHMAIDRVGIRRVRHPVRIRVGPQADPTSATWTLEVALPAERKGTHMSRFVAWMDAFSDGPEPLDGTSLGRALPAMLDRLEAEAGSVEVHFPFFIRKAAPVSGVTSLMDYEGAWMAEMHHGQVVTKARVVVPVQSLCPCSKEISDYGAHNQRSHVTIEAELDQPVGLEDLVRYAEDSASSPLWGLLKRPDEKWITEHAYDNPKFVEDLIRDVALRLQQDARIGGYRVEVENFESIHNHSAYACIERPRKA